MRLEKFRKAIEKKERSYKTGFSEIPDWITTGNYALNAVVSGRMDLGIPVSRTTMISGLSGSGKSFLVSNIVKNAQQKGYFCIYIDTENSVGDAFMVKIGVDLSEDSFMPVTLYSVEELVQFFADLLQNTTEDEKICLIVDSLSNLETERDLEKSEDGKVAYGQGLKEKLYKQLVRNINTKCGHRNMFAVFVAHEYVSGSDAYGNPICKPSVGQGTMYIPSVGLNLAKVDLKDGKEQVGITVRCKTYKTRYTSLGQKCSFDLPWDRGMSPTDGCLDILEECGIVNKNGAWYSYHNLDGDVVKFQSKNIDQHVEVLMARYAEMSGDVSEKDEDDANIDMIEEDQD